MTWVPLCMDAPEWAHWQKSNRVGRGVRSDARPCEDCPLSFAAEMRSVGKCNGVPMGGTADDDEEDAVVDTLRTVAPRPAIVTGKELPVALTTPCARCAHAKVCRIRDAMEARLETLPVQLPQLNPAIRVSIAATVECAEFMALRKDGRAGRKLSPEGYAKIVAANKARAERQRATA